MNFHEWLKNNKGLTEQQIKELQYYPKKYMRLSKQYLGTNTK